MRVLEQTGYLSRTEPGDRFDLEILEGRSKSLPPAEHGDPGEPGLEAFQAESLVETVVGQDRAAPFSVVIHEVLRRRQRPPTAACHGRRDRLAGGVPFAPGVAVALAVGDAVGLAVGATSTAYEAVAWVPVAGDPS